MITLVQLRKEAKLLQKKAGIKYTVAIEEVAKLHGFKNYSDFMHCMKNTKIRPAD